MVMIGIRITLWKNWISAAIGELAICMPIWPGAAWPSPAACWAKAGPKPGETAQARRRRMRPKSLQATCPVFRRNPDVQFAFFISVSLARAWASREICAARLRGFVIAMSQPQSLTYINMPYVMQKAFGLCLVRLRAEGLTGAVLLIRRVEAGRSGGSSGRGPRPWTFAKASVLGGIMAFDRNGSDLAGKFLHSVILRSS